MWLTLRLRACSDQVLPYFVTFWRYHDLPCVNSDLPNKVFDLSLLLDSTSLLRTQSLQWHPLWDVF